MKPILEETMKMMTATTNSIVELQNVEVKYGVITALHGVSMSIPKGAIVSLIGANGAGKSTLLKALVGLEPVSSGSIHYEGELLFGSTDSGKAKGSTKTNDLVQRGIALVPEGRRVFKDLTVRENLDMGAFSVKNEKEIKNKMAEMFDFFPILKDRSKQKAGSLSGGEQQMLAVARAMMSSPKLLLLDEPGLGLAPLIVQDIFNKIEIINKEEDVTVFVVEQNAKLALKSSTYGYVMENGRILLEGESRSLLKNPQVLEAYLGE